MRAFACLIACLVLASCGDDGEGDAPLVVPSAVARFALPPTGPIDWGEVPFPSDLYRDESGKIRIGAWPVEQPETPLHTAARDLLQKRDGFCATCNAYFKVDGDIDPASLPQGDGATPNDAVVLVDVDPTSPERGRLFPLRVEWNAERDLLAVHPVRGIALHRTRRYAAVLTNQLLADDGSPVGASEDFRQVRGTRSVTVAEVERARIAFAPVFAELERVGIRRDRVVSLASFTTEDVTAEVREVRAVVQGGAPLEVVIERRRVFGEEIDELLGIPSVDRPGIDVPPAMGSAGTRSIAHESIDEVVTGYFLAPRVVTGSGTAIGTARRDDQNRIVAGPRERVPFLLTIPKTFAASPLPIVVAHHGFNASRTTGFATADTVAQAGMALLAIDAFQHGERAASARDLMHALRGNLAGPDGFAETSTLDVSSRVFGLSGAASGLELFPGYSLGAFLQFAADIESAVRVVREGALAEAVEVLDFDTARIGFIGNSLGSVVGVSVLTAEPDVKFAVQNVPPGSIIETLTESPEFRPLVETLFLPIFGIQGPFDEVNRRLIFDPVIDISRWILEPIDPLALAPYLLLDPVRDSGPAEILFQVAALDEVAAPLPTQSMLAATGSDRVTVYDPAGHGMLEVLNQSSKFVPPVTPPFVRRSMELPVVNPIVDEHDEIEAFLTENLD